MIIGCASQPDAALPIAVRWIEDALLGSVATGVAVLAAFILFGAPMIVRELTGAVRGGESAAPEQVATGAIPPQPEIPDNAPENDPYAGAAMPVE